jgi:DNA polymerase-3 subunit delta
MDLRPKDLAAHLERTLAPIYLVHGDEPLLAIEAGDAIRAAARKAGCEEREVLVVEPGFKWDALAAASANLSLFGTRKLVDLRIPSGKPGVEGAKLLEDCAARPNPDQVLLVTLPKVDRATQSSGWFSALAGAGVAITVYPLERDELPAWIAGRLARQRLACPRRRSNFSPTAAGATCSRPGGRSRSWDSCCLRRAGTRGGGARGRGRCAV